MDKINNILKFLLIIPVLLISCQEETVIPPGPPVGEQIELVFSIVTGGGGATRSLTTVEEDSIKDIDILVFKEGYFVERAIGKKVEDTSATNEFRVILTTNNAPNNYLVAIANARQEVDAATLRGRKDDVLSSIVFENKATDGRWPANLENVEHFTHIPMWGEAGSFAINEELQKELTDNPIPLYRALACVDFQLASSVTNFELTSLHFYKYNTRGCVAAGPDAELDYNRFDTSPDPVKRVRNVTIPSDAVARKEFLDFPVENGNKSLTNSIYVLEIDRAERNMYEDASCLVVGGKYNGASNPTYYRIDFEIIWRKNTGGFGEEVEIEAGIINPLLGRTFARMLRNHVYDITVTSVSGPGAPNKEAALLQTNSHFEVSAATWNGHSVNIEFTNYR